MDLIRELPYGPAACKRAADEAPKEVEGRVDKDFPDIEVHLLSFPEVKNERAQEARRGIQYDPEPPV